MGDILFHSQSSAKLFGGLPEDYVPIHKLLDSSKLHLGDWRHRALLHSTFGIFICEQVFGDLYKRPSDGLEVSVRTVATQHIMEDLGAVPTAADWLKEMPIRRWMNGIGAKERRKMQYGSLDEMEIVNPEFTKTNDYEPCPKGNFLPHLWGTDGQHQNEFCKKCFISRITS